ncbi:hypothetical protein MTAT_23020 [Moorella thermoacetica]|uniref:Uncharacterized protein n=3 Tax=Neomoorella thermoacetica TaxID=1525 RepID=A0AAC9HID8_NEOTH|nr:hypothetical protein Maut_02019 [Moorella thermoacetica]TYL11038.1 hypothetical protein MTAT_23020 [Moorella thermoacetica]
MGIVYTIKFLKGGFLTTADSNSNVNIQLVTMDNFLRRLAARFQDRVANVEFFCGECCKKDKGGKLTLVGRDFIELIEVDDLKLKVSLFPVAI